MSILYKVIYSFVSEMWSAFVIEDSVSPAGGGVV
jgi:hypothetical protein